MSFIPYEQAKKPFKRKKTDVSLENVILQNRYSALADESMEAEDSDTGLTATASMKVDGKSSKVKVPPIVVYGKVDDPKYLDKLQGNMKDELSLKYKQNKTIVYTKNMEDYAMVEKEIGDSGVQYHTYAKPSEKLVKLVIKGLNENESTSHIKEELQKSQIKVIDVKQMVRKSIGVDESIKIPVFVVTFPAETPIKEIVKIRRLCYMVIHWEKYKNNREVLQCYNCQAFGHVSNNCHRKPNCLKCAGEHNTRDCPTKDKIDIPKCINCGGAHVASDVNCPVYLSVRDHRVGQQQQRNARQRIDTLQANLYTTAGETGSYRDKLLNRNHNNNRIRTPSPVSTNENNNFSDIIADVKEFFKNLNITRIIGVVKNTFIKMKNEADGLTKAAIFIEGVVEIFS